MNALPWRVGFGIDTHRFVENRELVLGGVTVPFELGLEGHSDADALTHALIDALLGAQGKGDIGGLFPDTDEKWKDAQSLYLLAEVVHSMKDSGWELLNMDATVITEKPKLAPYLEAMKGKLAECLGVDKGRLNLKATTSEGLGFIGAKEGLTAHCVVLLQQENS